MREDLTYKSLTKHSPLPSQTLANSLIPFVSLLKVPQCASLPHFYLPTTKGIN